MIFSKQRVTALSGFPEWRPAQQVRFEQWKAQAASHFGRHGFWPMETPAIERLSTLVSKGDDHEIYQVVRWKGEGDTTKTLDQQMGLRFDLTVPLARYVISHQGQIVFPYRRYHIAPVWRGERPQRGRYRQFYQCDIDVIGRHTLSPHHSSEMIGMMSALVPLLDTDNQLGPLRWAINHRCILTRWAEHAGIQDTAVALRWIDKRDKVDFDRIVQELSALGASKTSLDQLQQWSQPHVDRWEILRRLDWGKDFQEALAHVRTTLHYASLLGAPRESLVFDPLLARGLTYYSGLTYEASLIQHPQLGAVCAGGQYDHLAQSLGGKTPFPGAGLSLGLSRLFSLVVENSATSFPPPASVLVTVQDPTLLESYMQLAHMLRQSGLSTEQFGLSTEIYLENRPLSEQLKYANIQGHPFVIIANAPEVRAQQAHIKVMATGAQETLSWSKMIEFLKKTIINK